MLAADACTYMRAPCFAALVVGRVKWSSGLGHIGVGCIIAERLTAEQTWSHLSVWPEGS